MINIDNLIDVLKINGGFTARDKSPTYISGWGNITLAKSIVTVIEYDEKYEIICNIENEFGKIYYPFGETIITLYKETNEIKMKFVVCEEETYEAFDNKFNEDLLSSHFSKSAKKYVAELCNILQQEVN